MNNLPEVVAHQRHGRSSNPRPLERKSNALPLSHRATVAGGAQRRACWNVGDTREEVGDVVRRLTNQGSVYEDHHHHIFAQKDNIQQKKS